MSSSTEERTDWKIQRDLIEEFKWDFRLEPNQIGVSVNDGIVILTGLVDSYARRHAAEEDALRVRRVKAVVNDIEVSLPDFTECSNPVLAAAAVRARLGDGTATGAVDGEFLIFKRGGVPARPQTKTTQARRILRNAVCKSDLNS